MTDEEAETRGFKLWDDHPGLTIEMLNEQIKPHGLKLVIQQEGDALWFKVIRVGDRR